MGAILEAIKADYEARAKARREADEKMLKDRLEAQRLQWLKAEEERRRAEDAERARVEQARLARELELESRQKAMAERCAKLEGTYSAYALAVEAIEQLLMDRDAGKLARVPGDNTRDREIRSDVSFLRSCAEDVRREIESGS